MIRILCLSAVSGFYYCVQAYSANGNWTLSVDPEKECVHEFLCTPTNLTYYGDAGGLYDPLIGSTKTYYPSKMWHTYNSTTGCQALIDKNITKITFHGDSYMRQIYTGMLILLKGNYRNGSLIQDPGSIGCEYYKQLYEKRCGVQQLNHDGRVCGGKVLLDPLFHGIQNLHFCSPTENNHNIAVFSFGNHKTRSGNGGRWGVNNATIHQEMFSGSTCPALSEPPKNCKVYWVSTHYRLISWFSDETVEVIKEFNEHMRNFFEERKCGKTTGYIDVYNMTAQLALHHRHDAEQMTFDRVHWGFQVNLLKAITLLNAFITDIT